MDDAVTSVAMAALAADGLLAELSLDKVIVQLPARRQIGVTACAAYARAADLGNGIAFYPAVGAGAALLTLAAFAVPAAQGAPAAVTGLLAAAAASSLLHSAATGRAAPVPLQNSMRGRDLRFGTLTAMRQDRGLCRSDLCTSPSSGSLAGCSC